MKQSSVTVTSKGHFLPWKQKRTSKSECQQKVATTSLAWEIQGKQRRDSVMSNGKRLSELIKTSPKTSLSGPHASELFRTRQLQWKRSRRNVSNFAHELFLALLSVNLFSRGIMHDSRVCVWKADCYLSVSVWFPSSTSNALTRRLLAPSGREGPQTSLWPLWAFRKDVSTTVPGWGGVG